MINPYRQGFSTAPAPYQQKLVPSYAGVQAGNAFAAQRRNLRQQAAQQQASLAAQQQMILAEQRRMNALAAQSNINAGAQLAIPNVNDQNAARRIRQIQMNQMRGPGFYEQRRQERRGDQARREAMDLQRYDIDTRYDQTLAEQAGKVAEARETAEGFARSKTIEGWTALGQQQLRNRMDRYNTDVNAELQSQQLQDQYDLGVMGYDVQARGQDIAAETARYQMDSTLDRTELENQGRMDLLDRQAEMANRVLEDERAWQSGAVDRAYRNATRITRELTKNGVYEGEEDAIFQRVFADQLGMAQDVLSQQSMAEPEIREFSEGAYVGISPDGQFTLLPNDGAIERERFGLEQQKFQQEQAAAERQNEIAIQEAQRKAKLDQLSTLQTIAKGWPQDPASGTYMNPEGLQTILQQINSLTTEFGGTTPRNAGEFGNYGVSNPAADASNDAYYNQGPVQRPQPQATGEFNPSVPQGTPAEVENDYYNYTPPGVNERLYKAGKSFVGKWSELDTMIQGQMMSPRWQAGLNGDPEAAKEIVDFVREELQKTTDDPIPETFIEAYINELEAQFLMNQQQQQ